MLKAKDIHKAYSKLEILKGVDIEVADAEILAILGPSGAGKSTLLHILGTLDRADRGSVEIDGVKISTLSASKLNAFRNQRIGFIFQFHHLLPEFSAFENICIPGYIAKQNRRQLESRAHELMEMLGISARASHKPAELSGGEQQRVAIARSLINRPSIILADEPSGNLDTENAESLHFLFRSLRDQFKHTFIIVTHNQHLAAIADRQIVMRNGLIINAE